MSRIPSGIGVGDEALGNRFTGFGGNSIHACGSECERSTLSEGREHERNCLKLGGSSGYRPAGDQPRRAGRLWIAAAFEVVELCEWRVFSGHLCGSDVSLQRRGEATQRRPWYNNITDPSGLSGELLGGRQLCSHQFGYWEPVTVPEWCTASTSNTGSTGITFTLSPAFSAACNPSQNDVLIVRLTAAKQSACSQPDAERLFRQRAGIRPTPLLRQATRSAVCRCQVVAG